MPSNYIGISFNAGGECNYCTGQTEPTKFAGLIALKKDIDSILRNKPDRPYDCAVAFSGGRDSSYLLYFAKVVLGLRVLAVTMEHDFITPEAKDNIRRIVKELNVDSEVIQNKILNESSRASLRNWSKKPDVAMCLTFCTGCRYGILRMIPDYVKKKGIPILLVGDTPNELMDYRVNLLCDNRPPSTKNRMMGFAKRLIQNPSYLVSCKTLFYQIREFIHWSNTEKITTPHIIKPFYYIELREEEVLSKIKELGWEYNHSFSTTRRSDCYINMIRQYFYKKGLGYNDVDVYFARLLRNNHIQLPEAIQCIQAEGSYEESTIRSVLKELFGVDYDMVISNMTES